VDSLCHAVEVTGEAGEATRTTSRQPLKMGGFRVGVALARASWQTILADKELLWVPTIALGASALAILINILLYGGLHEAFDGSVVWVAIKAFPLAVVVYTLAVVSDAFIVAAARVRLIGADPTFEREWRVVGRRLPTLVAYGIVRATERTFTLVLSSFKRPGQWLADLIDAAWDFATFLAVPVILFERDEGAFRAVKRSAHLVRSRWGTQLVAQATIGLVVFLLVLPIALTAGLACAAGIGPTAVWVVVVASFVLLEVVTAALSAVLSAAMYRFLVTGHVSPRFQEDDLRAVFAEKKKR
jgi:hypothetical protein